jgi:hypothetical protein
MSGQTRKLGDRLDDVTARIAPTPPEPNPWHPVVACLSEDEQADLARAIVELEKSHGTASLESLAPAQRAVWLKAYELFEKFKTSAGN